MRLCNETVTVYNARVNPVTRMEEYVPTVLKGVSWHCQIVSRVTDSGLKAANVFTLRISDPVNASGKSYTEPKDYGRSQDISNQWTLQKGDVIVKGEVDSALPPAKLRDMYGADRVFTVLGITDDRRAPNAKHWKVVGA